MVPGIILAAGQSSRMRTPKALLLTPSTTTFVNHLTSALLAGGVSDVLIVGREDDEALIREVESIADAGLAARYIVNPHAGLGQLSSVIAGINAADRPGVTGAMIVPVDAPMILAMTVRSLLERFAAGDAAIVRATYRGRHGHPVIFARRLFDDLRHADMSVGAKSVVRTHQSSLVNLDLDDPGIVHDIDDPEDYARVFNVPG